MNTTTARRHTWVPYVAAVAGLALVVKVVLIIGTGDGLADDPLVVLYLTGVGLGLAAAVGAGLRQPNLGRRIAVGLGLVVLFAMWIMGIGDLLKPLVGTINDAQHVKDEVPIGLAGAALLGLAYVSWSRDQGVDSDRGAARAA